MEGREGGVEGAGGVLNLPGRKWLREKGIYPM